MTSRCNIIAKNNVEHITTINFRYIILFRFKIKFLFFTIENELNAFDSKCFECSIHSEIDHDKESFVIELNYSEIDITTITKATFVKKRIWRNNTTKNKKSRNNNWRFFHCRNWIQTIQWISRWLMQFFFWSMSKIENKKYSIFSLQSIKSISRSKYCKQILNRWKSSSWLKKFWNTNKSNSYLNA